MGESAEQRERRMAKERERGRDGKGVGQRRGTLSWFPSGDFIMAFSYYRRTSGHERDTILRQGTEADLTSGQIYGRTNALSALASKSRPTSKGLIQRTPIMITMIAIIRQIDGRTDAHIHTPPYLSVGTTTRETCAFTSCVADDGTVLSFRGG